MSKKYLIIDCNYICHRAKHSYGLEHNGKSTGIIFGFLADIKGLQEFHRTNDFLFCWDYGKNKRKEFYRDYKGNRLHDQTPEEVFEREAFQEQVSRIREHVITELGYQNNFYQWGYEGDDSMADIALNLNEDDQGIMITSDKDLMQCIRHNVSFDAPKKPPMTLQGFFKTYGIEPKDYAKVKALAGCTSDNVKGIKGVGEKTAIKFLRKELSPTTKAFARIVSKQGGRVFKRNMKMVCLPYKGTQHNKIQNDTATPAKWNRLVNEFKFYPLIRKRK